MIIDDTNERMDKSIQFLVSELKKIRAGKAMPSMLDGIMVEYYGGDREVSVVTLDHYKGIEAGGCIVRDLGGE